MNNTPIIFLDVDGVMTTTKQHFMDCDKFMNKNLWAKNLDVRYPFDAKCVKVLNKILMETDAEIVLTSDWRIKYDLYQLDIIFKKNGVIKSPVDITGDEMVSISSIEKNRSAQIREHLIITNPKYYVIIDDLFIGSFLSDNQKSHFVRTSNDKGLKDLELKNKIIRVLKGDLKK